MIYAYNNSAKDWILQQISQRVTAQKLRICDLACGTGAVWKQFLIAHPHVTYIGYDFNPVSISTAQELFRDVSNASFQLADVQKLQVEKHGFDIVTTLSSLEHVVRIDQFLQVLFSLLKQGGYAYINYDSGHFRSTRLKEKIMIPLGQLLARLGYEQLYMKHVSDRAVILLLERLGMRVLDVRKHNIEQMKHFTKAYGKDLMDESVIVAWQVFENALNASLSASQLDAVCGSTVITAERL